MTTRSIESKTLATTPPSLVWVVKTPRATRHRWTSGSTTTTTTTTVIGGRRSEAFLFPRRVLVSVLRRHHPSFHSLTHSSKKSRIDFSATLTIDSMTRVYRAERRSTRGRGGGDADDDARARRPRPPSRPPSLRAARTQPTRTNAREGPLVV